MAKDLIEAARTARKNAYAPYSKFFVGAALRAPNGNIYTGCNVENAAYPQGTCAEAGAISAMVLAGSDKISEIVIVGSGNAVVTPCGGCRQKIREFAGDDCSIVCCDEDGNVKGKFTLGELLPHSFGSENMQ